MVSVCWELKFIWNWNPQIPRITIYDSTIWVYSRPTWELMQNKNKCFKIYLFFKIQVQGYTWLYGIQKLKCVNNLWKSNFKFSTNDSSLYKGETTLVDVNMITNWYSINLMMSFTQINWYWQTYRRKSMWGNWVIKLLCLQCCICMYI